MSSSTSPCAACKSLQLNCTQGCMFAPYFPADQQRFSNVFHVYGTEGVAKMLNRVSPEHRKDLADSLAHHADMRLIDPVYGCVGEIVELRLRQKREILELQRQKREILELQEEIDQKRHVLEVLKRELAKYVGPAAADAAVDRAAAVARAAIVADDDDDAGASLGHVLTPPPLFYHHPQQLVPESGICMGFPAIGNADGSGVQIGNVDGDADGPGVQIGSDVQIGNGDADVQIGDGDGDVYGSDADEPTITAFSSFGITELHSQAEMGAKST